MKRLQKCCCCASTRTGTYITGILGIIASIITIVLIWAFDKRHISFSTALIFGQELDDTLTRNEVPRILITINLIFTILISALLMVAVQRRRFWLMLPWIVLGIVLAIGLLISIIHTSVTYYSDDKIADHILIATLLLVGGLLYLCLFLYLWAVVFSHYLDIRDEEERGRYRKAPYRR